MLTSLSHYLDAWTRMAPQISGRPSFIQAAVKEKEWKASKLTTNIVARHLKEHQGIGNQYKLCLVIQICTVQTSTNEQYVI